MNNLPQIFLNKQFHSLTWSKSSQVEHQPQQNQPRKRGGTVVIGPVGLISHESRVWTSVRGRHIPFGFWSAECGIWRECVSRYDPVCPCERAGTHALTWLTCPTPLARWWPYWPARRRRPGEPSRSLGNRSHSEGPACTARTFCTPDRKRTHK